MRPRESDTQFFVLAALIGLVLVGGILTADDASQRLLPSVLLLALPFLVARRLRENREDDESGVPHGSRPREHAAFRRPGLFIALTIGVLFALGLGAGLLAHQGAHDSVRAAPVTSTLGGAVAAVVALGRKQTKL